MPTKSKKTARQVYREARPWVIRLARFGYAAKGIVYMIIGGLALQSALGSGGETTGPVGAIQEVARQPFGKILLAAIALGLAGYAIWRFVQAIIDPEHEGSDLSGLVKRGSYLIRGLIYASFAATAGKILIGNGGGSSEGQEESMTAQLMSQPFGIWLVGIVGLVIIGAGLYQFYEGYSGKFKEELKLHEMNKAQQRWATFSGRTGLIARAVVYSLIGIFLLQAAWQADPQEAGGLGEALQTLASQPYGPWLLGLVAVGLALYGFYSLALARFRRIYIRP